MARTKWGAVLAATTVAGIAGEAQAKDAPSVELAHCDKTIGTIAVVDGDAQGWTKFGLGSPRELIMAMAVKSGCFTPYDKMGGAPADFLVNAVAGDREEVDKSIEAAKGAATEAVLRTGMLRRVPLAGGMLGMMGGLGGKKKTVAAGLRILSPANGQTIVSGTGLAAKSIVTFGGAGNVWADTAGAATQGYGNYLSSADGQLLVNAFAQAFNNVVAQGEALAAARPVPVAAPAPAAAVTTAGYTVAIDTQMYGQPARQGATVRALRATTSLMPTGKREGLFVEVTDNFGTQGWVSVEDLK